MSQPLFTLCPLPVASVRGMGAAAGREQGPHSAADKSQHPRELRRDAIPKGELPCDGWCRSRGPSGCGDASPGATWKIVTVAETPHSSPWDEEPAQSACLASAGWPACPGLGVCLLVFSPSHGPLLYCLLIRTAAAESRDESRPTVWWPTDPESHHPSFKQAWLQWGRSPHPGLVEVTRGPAASPDPQEWGVLGALGPAVSMAGTGLRRSPGGCRGDSLQREPGEVPGQDL
nr:uncharacterized protein LOC114079821 [Marmota flaviventris]